MKLKAGEGKGRIALFGVVAVAAFTMVTGVALASSSVQSDVNGTLTAGALGINSVAAIDLGSHVVDGHSGTLTPLDNSGTIVAQDLSGSGGGYQVQVQRSAFIGNVNFGTAELPVYKTLDTTMSWQAPVVTLDSSSDSTSTAPVAVTGPTTIPTASAVNIASADADTGMGIYDLTFGASGSEISTTYAANAYAGAYAGSVTVSVVSGPS